MDELAILLRPASTQREKVMWFQNLCASTSGDIHTRFVQAVGKRVLHGEIHGFPEQIERAIAYELQYLGAVDCGQVGDLSAAFLARRAAAIGVVTMAKVTKVKCEKCGKAVEAGGGLVRPFGVFCGAVCLKAHLAAPSKATVANATEDCKRIEEASIIMKANKGKMGKVKAVKGKNAVKPNADGRVKLTIVPSAGAAREIDPESKTRFKLGTRMFEVLARIVQLAGAGKTVSEITSWIEANIPGTGYWRICTSAHPEWFKIKDDATVTYSGPALKVVTMDRSASKPKPKAKAKPVVKAKPVAKPVAKTVAKTVAKKFSTKVVEAGWAEAPAK